MPNKDGTGPTGNGPKTGKGQGNCEEKRNRDCPRKNRMIECKRNN